MSSSALIPGSEIFWYPRPTGIGTPRAESAKVPRFWPAKHESWTGTDGRVSRVGRCGPGRIYVLVIAYVYVGPRQANIVAIYHGSPPDSPAQ